MKKYVKLFLSLIITTFVVLASSCDIDTKKSTSTIKPTHTHSYVDTVINPTCEEQGYTEHRCECGEIYKDTYKEALGHSYSEWEVIKEATETEPGEKQRKCSKCNTIEKVSIPVLGHIHKYVDAIINPTCEEQGYTEHKCDCGEVYMDTYKEALGHDLTHNQKIEATCEEEGVIEHWYCNTCKKYYNDSALTNEVDSSDLVISKSEHIYGTWSIDTYPTEDTTGLLKKVCSNNQKHYETYEIPKLNDIDYNYEIIEIPACGQQGTAEVTFIKDDQTIQFEIEISALNHNLTKVKSTNATCTTNGNIEYWTCSNCNCIYSDSSANNEIELEDTIITASHNYGNWDVSDYPTLDTIGTLTRSCSNDSGHIETYKLPVLNNTDYTYREVLAPACLSTGVASFTIIKDNQTFMFTAITAASGHTFGSWEITTYPTIETAGLLTRTCTVDSNHTETYELPLLNISDYQYKVITDAKCEKEGTANYIFTKDNQQIVFPVVLAALGHVCDSTTWNDEVPAKCEENGIKEHYLCSSCNTYFNKDLKIIDDLIIPALTHTYEAWEETVVPTIETTGLLTRVCANDSNHTETYELPVLNETDYVYNVTLEAKCEATGTAEYTYTKDNQEFTFEVVFPALTHTYEAWEETVVPTTETTGLLTRVCANDSNHTETYELPILNETDYVYEVILNPSCEATGTAEYTYTKDNQEFTFDVELEPAHSFIYSYDPNQHYYECECGLKINIENHNLLNGNCQICGYNNGVNYLTFTLSEDGTYYIVTDCSSPATSVDIPNIYNDLPVIEIATWAFSRSNDNLSTVVFSENIIKMDFSPFERKLEHVYYRGTIEDWCNISFADSTSNPMYYAEHFYMLDENNEWYELTELVIPETITSIGNYQFYGFEGITSIEIPNSVTSIDSGAFYGFEGITSIEIPTSVISIGDSAFGGCSSLESITIPFVGATLDGTENTHFGYIFGAYSDFYNSTYVPNSLKKVIITGGTSIGLEAFFYCSSLTSIEIPSSVTCIGKSAFSGCSSLEDVYYEGTLEDWCNLTFSNETSNPMYYAERLYLLDENNEWYELTELEIPETITSIGNYQFYGLDNLTKLTIPSHVTTIGDYAFNYCTNLASLEIPETVTTVGRVPFAYCTGINCVTITPTNATTIASIFGDSFSSNVYFEGTLEDWLGLNFIDWELNPMYYAEHFYMLDENNEWYELTELVIPETITSIGNYQFAGYKGFTSITIPSHVKSIGDMAFFEAINLNEVIIEEGLESIGYGSFAISSITNIKLPNSLLSIGEVAFGYTKITNITIPEKVTKIGSATFAGVSILSINVDSKNLVYDSRDNCNAIIETSTNKLIVGCGNTIIPSSVEAIGEMAFNECVELTTITIHSGITTIDNNAFYGCINLASIEMSEGITHIGQSAFNHCDSLTNIEIPSSVIHIGDTAFANCINLTNITLPNIIIDLGESVFDNCENLENVYYKGTIESWVQMEFYNRESNPMYYAEHFYMLDENNNWYEPTELVIPESVATIKSYVFYNFKNITSVYLPSSLTTIKSNAFVNCKYTSINIDSNVLGNVNYIIGTLEKVYYRGTIEEWCNVSFSYETRNPMYYANNIYMLNQDNEWYELTEVVIPNTITSIGDYQFYGFNSLIRIEIPTSVISVGLYAFANCTSVTSIEIPTSVTSIGSFALHGCSNLTSVTVSQTYTIDPNNVFNTINNEFFYLFGMSIRFVPTSLKEVKITGGTTIEDYTFKNCSNITNIILSDTITSIGLCAFYDCSNLVSLILPSNVTSIGQSAFYGCTSLTSIEIPNSVTNIEQSTFNGCTSLTSIEIPTSVTSIGQYAFSGCSNLETITLPFIGAKLNGTNNTYFGYIFGARIHYEQNQYIPETLKEVHITNTTTLPENAFYDCGNITTISLSSTITNILSYAFRQCSALENVYYNGTSEEWNNITIGSYNNELASATIYYYSDTQPVEEGNYWYYDTAGNIVVW